MDVNMILLSVLLVAVAAVYITYSTTHNSQSSDSHNKNQNQYKRHINRQKPLPQPQPRSTSHSSNSIRVSTAPSILNRSNEPVTVLDQPQASPQHVSPYQLRSADVYSGNVSQRKTELDKLITEVLDIATGSGAEGWAQQSNVIDSNDCDVYCKLVSDSTVPIVRASCTVAASPVFVVNCVTQFKHREKFQYQFAYGRVIETLDHNTRIEYVENTRQWPTQTRDFCLIRYTRILQANTTLDTYANDVPIIVAYQSIQHPQAPHRPNYVRAHTYIYAWLLRPVRQANNTFSTNIMFCCQIDPRGNLPHPILYKQSIQQATVCLKLIKYTQQFNAYQLQTQTPDNNQYNDNNNLTPPISQPHTPTSTGTSISGMDQYNSYATTPNGSDNFNHMNYNVYMPSPTQPRSVTPSNRSLQSSPATRSYSDDSGVFNENEQYAMSQPIQSLMSVEPNVSEQLVAYSNVVIKELLAAAASQHWEVCKTVHDVQISSRQTRDSPIHAFRGIGVIKCPPKQVFDAVRNPYLRYKYDNMLKSIRVVAEVDDYTQIIYMHHEARKCILKTSRDFCFLAKGREPDGPNQPYIHVGRSIDFVGCPVKEKLVRAELMSSGWIITPANAAGTWANVVYIARVDVKGDISSSMWNLIGKKQPLAIHYLRKQLEK